MELTRRDAVAALAASGAAVGGAWLGRERFGGGEGTGPPDPVLSDAEMAVLVAVASVVYPSAVDGVETFVETYSRGRIDRVQDDAYRRGVIDAVATLDSRARSWYGGPYRTQDVETQASLLREVGADVADPDPDGTDAERVRHYLINELLFALYASPTGGKLVGIENPQGYPGGLESYRRGPEGGR